MTCWESQGKALVNHEASLWLGFFFESTNSFQYSCMNIKEQADKYIQAYFLAEVNNYYNYAFFDKTPSLIQLY